MTTPTPRQPAELRRAVEHANLAALDRICLSTDLGARILAAASAAIQAEVRGEVALQVVAITPAEHAELVQALEVAGLALRLSLVRLSFQMDGPPIGEADAFLDATT